MWFFPFQCSPNIHVQVYTPSSVHPPLSIAFMCEFFVLTSLSMVIRVVFGWIQLTYFAAFGREL